MRPALSIVLLVAAAFLLFFGFQAADSISSSFSKFFSGTPTDHSIWLILGGAVCAVLGLLGLRGNGKLAGA